MTNELLPLYILLGTKVLAFLALAFYLQHIISKKIIWKRWANIIMIVLLALTVFTFYTIYMSLWQPYNPVILTDHILSFIYVCVLAYIGIFVRK